MKKEVKKEINKDSFWNASMSDIALTKLAVFFGTLFLVLIFPTFFFGLEDWKWAFILIAVLLAIKPLRSFLKK